VLFTMTVVDMHSLDCRLRRSAEQRDDWEKGAIDVTIAVTGNHV
jgi:hypothetical protein